MVNVQCSMLNGQWSMEFPAQIYINQIYLPTFLLLQAFQNPVFYKNVPVYNTQLCFFS